MNIKEVAKRARVSTATVSRTINNSEKVKPGTAARVRKAIEELNFYPNTHARTLVSGRSRMLGLIISDITNPFFPELVKSFEDQAVQGGQEVIIGNTDYNPKRMAGCIRRMVERKVDGVAIMTSEADPALVTELTRRNIPTGLHGHWQTGAPQRQHSNRLCPGHSRSPRSSFLAESPADCVYYRDRWTWNRSEYGGPLFFPDSSLMELPTGHSSKKETIVSRVERLR